MLHMRQEHARHEAALRQLQELTLHPVINRNYAGVRPAISLKQPGPYLAEVPALAEMLLLQTLYSYSAASLECIALVASTASSIRWHRCSRRRNFSLLRRVACLGLMNRRWQRQSQDGPRSTTNVNCRQRCASCIAGVSACFMLLITLRHDRFMHSACDLRHFHIGTGHDANG